MKITGLRTERVEIEISETEFMNKLWQLLNINRSNWICKNDKGNLAIFYDGAGSHSCEIEDKELTEQEIELYNAINVIEKYILK